MTMHTANTDPRLLATRILAGLLLSIWFMLSPDRILTAQTTDASATVAFVNVNVVPMDSERVLEGQTVIVRNGRIERVGPTAEVTLPEGAVEIDGSGRYLMPGLAEMHGHVPGSDDPQYTEDVLFLYVSNGVTTVRGMAGHPSHLTLRERIARGDILGPTLFAAGPGFTGRNAGTPQDAVELVREQHEAGYDLLKVFEIPQESYDQMSATASALGMPFAGHIPSEVGLEGALEAQQSSIDHLDRYVEFLVQPGDEAGTIDGGFFGSAVVYAADTSKIDEAVERTVAAGTWNVPTLSLVEHLASTAPAEEMAEWPEMRYMPREVVDGWVDAKRDFQERDDFQPPAPQQLVAIRRILTKALHDGGAPIALGSDAPQFFNVPGFSIHHEMRMMEESDLTPYEVLVTGTRNPAEYFGTPEAFGTVEEGRRADLILLNANPLENIPNVQDRAGVMVRGQWLPESEIQARLDQIAARAAED